MKIGYLLKTYPKVSETFILQEILALEQEGYPLHIVSLQQPTDDRCHDTVSRVKARVDYLDDKSLKALQWLPVLFLGLLQRPLETLMAISRAFANTRHASLSPGRQLGQAVILANIVKRENICHLHAHFATEPTEVAELVRLLTGTGFSISAHAKDIYLSPRQNLARKIRDARFVVTCTEYNRRYLDQLNASSTPIHRIYHGLDLNRFEHRPARQPPSPSPLPLILSVARLREKKGLDTLIRACALLDKQGHRFHCEIVGYGPLHDSLQQLIEQLGLTRSVVLRGQLIQRELIELYRQACVFVLPCRISEDGDRDGIPNVLMEAMALQIPVVTTAVSGIPELVEDGVTGLLVPPDQPPSLARALGDLLMNQPIRQSLALGGSEKVRTRFALAPNLSTLKHLFDELLNQGPGQNSLHALEESNHAG